MIKRINNRRKNRRGTAALEFAIAGPVLLLVVFLAFEFARLSMIRNLAQNACYEAARFGMVEGATAAETEARALEVLQMLATRGAEITVNDGVAFDRTTGSVKVHVSVSMEENAFVIPWLYQGRFINTEMELRTEKYAGFFDPDA